MFRHTINAGFLKAALVAIAIAALTVFISVPGGAKEKSIGKGELKSLVANAETKGEHERLAQHFDAEAARYEAEAAEHGELAGVYKKSPSAQPTKFPGGMQTFNHCDSLSKSLTKAAEDARALAAEHREMAGQAKK